jgi:hypothetical protein
MSTTVARRVNDGTGWYLVDESKMLEALQALTDWDGDIARTDGVWQLTLRSSGKQTLIVCINQWLVLDDGLKILDRSAFKDTYEADDFPPEAEPPAPEAVVDSPALLEPVAQERSTPITQTEAVQPNA